MSNKFWVKVHGESVVEGPMTLPANYPIDGKTAGEWSHSELLAKGYRPVVDKAEHIDREKYLVSETTHFEFHPDHVVEVRAVKPIPKIFMEELQAFKQQMQHQGDEFGTKTNS